MTLDALSRCCVVRLILSGAGQALAAVDSVYQWGTSIGHPAHATFPLNFAAWAPQRTLGVL